MLNFKSTTQDDLVDISFTLLTKPMLLTEGFALKEELDKIAQNSTLYSNLSLANGDQTTKALNNLNVTLSGAVIILNSKDLNFL